MTRREIQKQANALHEMVGDEPAAQLPASQHVHYHTPPQTYYPQHMEPKASGLGIAGLICGLLAIAFSVVPFCGFIPAIFLALTGIVLSFVGLLAADRHTKDGFAAAGLIVSVLAIALPIALLIMGVTLLGGAAASR